MTSIRIAAIMGAALLATVARAQEPVAVGGSGRPSVEVNLDALDRLGGESGVMIGQPYGSRYGRPALPNEARPGQKPIVLKPPRLNVATGGPAPDRRAVLTPPPPPEPKPPPETPAPVVSEATPAPQVPAPTPTPRITPPTLGPAPSATSTAPPPASPASPASPPAQVTPPAGPPRQATTTPPAKPAPAATPSAPVAQAPTRAPTPAPTPAPTAAPRDLAPRRTDARPIAPETIAAAVTAGLPPIETPGGAAQAGPVEPPAPSADAGSGLLAGGAFGSLGAGAEPPAESAPPAAPGQAEAPAAPPADETPAAATQLLAGGAFGVEERAPAAGRPPPRVVPPPAPAPAPAMPPARQGDAPQLLAGGALGGAPPLPPGQRPITGGPAPRGPVAVAPADSRVVPPAPPPGPQVATAPSMAPAPTAEGPMLLRITFGPGEDVLSAAAQSQLSRLAKRLAGNGERINIKAYAAQVKDGTAARRLSLSRALAVRRFLGDQKVAVARINVTAVGTPGDSGPADRVDIVSIGR